MVAGGTAARAVLAAAATAILLLVPAGLSDLDRDGLSAWREREIDTVPWQGDSDKDGLADGWEIGANLDPRDDDTDADGLADGRELNEGSDPQASDSDNDGLDDWAEAATPDCDKDGVPAAAESDGDADGRPDNVEPQWRCVADVDGDGVLDGWERHATCVLMPDCDFDGLGDGVETAPFDALRPDSAIAGMLDGVSYSFQVAGQPASADQDGDGIPDGWEDTEGLVAWGDLRPVRGERDLLVEFVRVVSPASAKVASLSFVPAYQYTAQAFQAAGIHMRWIETVVRVDNETRPIDLEFDDPHYKTVLPHTRHAKNPFVTTVVLSPQRDQTAVAHGGLAQLRSMFAAVDYGAYLNFSFQQDNGVAWWFRPILESNAIANAAGAGLSPAPFASVTMDSGLVAVTLRDGRVVRWQPDWFQSMPIVSYPNGHPDTPLTLQSVSVNQTVLASTILHELGHTLGLCHPHEPDCQARLPSAEQSLQATSAMSYDAPDHSLVLLPSEWSRANEYLACPPVSPLVEVADHAPGTRVLASKYGRGSGYGERHCRSFSSMTTQFQPVAATTYLPPHQDRPLSVRGPQTTWIALGGGVLLCGLVGATVAALRPRISTPT